LVWAFFREARDDEEGFHEDVGQAQKIPASLLPEVLWGKPYENTVERPLHCKCEKTFVDET
jgi:hypothetical protein